VQSAIARPYMGYDKPIYKKAAALLQSVATNHGFVDGNKRTALYLVNLFLHKSGYVLQSKSLMDQEEEIEHLIMDVVVKFLEYDELVLWFKKRVQPSA